ncbi:unnamed protein product [Mytilus edulis]|uniref:Uncharacterized protein n=1 Tax=Mytilus edulis TaxID=6550 RepID=A0A8S3T223_MYTED|nr:unnamed protein product [Mytilus edulis]
MDQNHKETSDLRHDVDTKLALLTSQMQQMFISFQNKTKHDTVQNAANGTQELERKYQELWVNFTHLQNKLDEIQMNFTKEMAQCKNKIMGHEKELTDLRTLKNIQPLRDATIVKNQLQSVNTELHALSVSDHARREDFRALYNLTVNGQKYTQEQLREQNVSISQRFHHFGNRENASLDMLNRKIEVLIEKKNNMTQEKQRSQDRMLEDLKRNVNLTLTNLQLQISNNGDKVAMTACNIDGGVYSADTNIATIVVYRNNNTLAKVYITYDSDDDTSAGTGTAVVSVELQIEILYM